MSSTRWLGHFMLVYSVVYMVLAFRKAYRESFWKSAFKMFVVGGAYAIALVGAIAGAVFVAARVEN